MLMIVSREIEMLGKDGGFGGQRCHLSTVLCRNVTTLHYSNGSPSSDDRISRSSVEGVQSVRVHGMHAWPGTLEAL